MFCTPTIPGPEIKNPKASLNDDPTYSGYSSDPKTYLNSRVEVVTSTSNSKIQASLVVAPAMAFSRLYPALPWSVPKQINPPALGLLTFPVPKTIPSFNVKFRLACPPVKVPAAVPAQFMVAFLTTTPCPASIWASAAALLLVVTVTCANNAKGRLIIQ